MDKSTNKLMENFPLIKFYKVFNSCEAQKERWDGLFFDLSSKKAFFFTIFFTTATTALQLDMIKIYKLAENLVQ